MSPARGIIAGRRQYMEHALAALPAAGPTHGFHAHNSRSPGLRGPDGGEQRQVAAHLVLVNIDLDEHAVGEFVCHFDERWPDALARATPCRREVHAHELRGGSQSREAGPSTANHALSGGSAGPARRLCRHSRTPRRCWRAAAQRARRRPLVMQGRSRSGRARALLVAQGDRGGGAPCPLPLRESRRTLPWSVPVSPCSALMLAPSPEWLPLQVLEPAEQQFHVVCASLPPQKQFF